MATLFSQPPRNYYKVSFKEVNVFIEGVLETATETGVQPEFVLRVFELCELQRTNNLKAWDGDAKDEQLAGFGEILRDFLNDYLQTKGEN
jgi:hypothetical protein